MRQSAACNTGIRMSACHLCPRNCSARRTEGALGVCRAPADIKVAREDLHFGEEPLISGTRGSGTIFFSHCPLGCIYCQNAPISKGGMGQKVDVDHLTRAMLHLQERGAHNINFVTGTQYASEIASAVRSARNQGLEIPTVWNSSGYESVHTLRMLEDMVDVFMPDFKYWSSDTAAQLSKAPDYPEVAKEALSFMFRMRPEQKVGEDGTLARGVLVRHLVLPGHTRESKFILRWLEENAPEGTYISIMSQYTPTEAVADHPLLGRRVTEREYTGVLDYTIRIGLQNVFVQDPASATSAYVPEFYDTLPDA